jgi:hypothetical protein
MATQSLTPKEQYEQSLKTILQIVMDMPQLSDGDWKAIGDETAKLWNLRERLSAVQRQVVIIEDNRYYRERVIATPRTMMLTAQDKATSEQYTHCVFCESNVKKSYLLDHQLETKKCLEIRLTLEMKKRYFNSKVAWKQNIRRLFEKYRSHFDIVHYFIRHRLVQKEPSGMWWVYNLDDCVFDDIKLNPFRKSVLTQPVRRRMLDRNTV